MLELGQPLHAYDATRLTGRIVVRRARAGRDLTTLDDVQRRLDPDDLLITDDSGPIGLAGVMGGASTEIGELAEGERSTSSSRRRTSTRPTIARAARRHKLPSEASRRFERDGRPAAAAGRGRARRARCSSSTAAARSPPGAPTSAPRPAPRPVRMALDLPDRVAGVAYPRGATVRRLRPGGVRGRARRRAPTGAARSSPRRRRGGPTSCSPPTSSRRCCGWRATTRSPRCCRTAPAGRGLTPAQRAPPRGVGALAEAGYVEVLPFPFVGPATWDAFGLPADDVRRRHTVAVANPLDADRAELRDDAAAGPARHARAQPRRAAPPTSRCYTVGPGRAAAPRAAVAMPDPGVDGRARRTPRWPRSTPRCPPSRCTSASCWPATGSRAAGGGAGRPAGWADAIRPPARRRRPRGVELRMTARRQLPPWHPGRCAVLRVGDCASSGHAGELHPKVDRRARAAAAHLRDGAGPRPAAAASTTGRCRGCRPTRRCSVDVALVVGGRGARRPTLTDALARRRRRPPGGRAALRRLHRRAGGRGQRGRWPSRCASAPRTGR